MGDLGDKTGSLPQQWAETDVSLPPGAPTVEGYQILGRLGEGGMGAVWRAVQLSTRRDVALKLLGATAFGSERAQARFEREVELTARLEHPHIATIYDSGLRQGVYYYAMELIDGAHLDEHVVRRQLSQRQTLELMRTVCEAVQHAHQRGVIHRDLKPSNILVTEDGQPHVLDFGLAKTFLEGDERLTISADGDIAGTPAYMSPEQAAGRNEQIDTRTDVYSLGVILFRLVTGESPHDLSGTRYEVLRRIAEEDVRRPRELSRNVDKELEALLLKALAPAPDHRYASAGDLAQDLGNYLSGEPLTARKPTTAYFLAKRIRKYRVPVGLGAAALLALAGLALFAYLRIAEQRNLARTAAKREQEAANRERTARTEAETARETAQTEAKKATAVTEFLEDMLGSVDPAQARGRNVTVREVLDRAAARVGHEFAEQPQVEASLRDTIGSTYQALGRYDDAESQLRKAVDIRRRVLGANHGDTLASRENLAVAEGAKGEFAQAETTLREILAVRKRDGGERHRHTLTTQSNLAVLMANQAKYAEAEALHRKTLAARREVLGAAHPQTLTSMDHLATVLGSQGKYAEVERLHRKTLAAKRLALGADHPDTLASMDALALVLNVQGKHTEAEKIQREALAARRRILPPHHADTLTSTSNLAVILGARGRLDEAEKLHRQVLGISRRVLGEQHPDTLITMGHLALVVGARGKYAEAETLGRSALAAMRRTLPKDHPSTLRTMANLARALGAQGKHAEAETLYRTTLAARRRVLPKDHPDTLSTIYHLALTLQKQGTLAEAEALFREALPAMQRVLGRDHQRTLATTVRIAVLLARRGENTDAEPLLRKAYAGMRKTLGEKHSYTLQVLGILASVLEANGKTDEAKELLRTKDAIPRGQE